MSARTVSKVFICGTDSADDILNLDLDYPVHSMAIVYRTTSDGDLLYWTDGLNRPRYLNVDTVATLAPFTEDMINAAKNAPVIPVSATYRDDATVTVNNLRKQLFQFGLRWKYANLEYSTISPFSKLPLPVNFTNVDTQNDPTKNNNIRLTFKTGGSDFTEVELLGRVSTGTSFGNWFSIVNLDKDDYSFNPDTNYTFDFYNDGTYSTAGGVYINNNPTDGELYFSYLPDLANTLETLNGNVIIYGGVTDGYDVIPRADIDVTVIAGVSNPSIPTISWNQANTNQLIIYIGSTISVGAVYHIDFLYDAPAPNTSKVINYVTLFGDTQNSVANAIVALLTGGSLTATNTGAGVIELSNSAGGIYTVHMSVSTSGSDVAAPSWDWACPERLGLIYFDDRGKTNGVISFVTDATDTTDFAVTTPVFTTVNNVPQVPYLAATLNHTPPTWATSYQWVRAALTPKLLYWVSNDYQTDTDYLYICIENLTYTKSKISGYVPSYDFVKGDRIKICASYNTGTGFFTPYSVQLDMEILGVTTRTMTSPASNGTFIKVAKPSTFPSAAYQANMLVKLYTPYVRQTDTQQIFFEWGEEYAIYENGTLVLGYTLAFGTFQVGETIIEAVTNATGVVTAVSSTQLTITSIVGTFQTGLTFTGMTSGAAGTINTITTGAPFRYHRGQITDQTSGQPATFQWFDGDCYFRTRQFYLDVNGTTTTTIFTIDQNYSDYFVSEVNSNGRGWRIEPNAATIYKQVQARWGQSYQQDTDINGLNIFYPNDFDTYDLGKGSIQRFKTRNRIMRVFQEDGVGEVGVYAKYIKDSGNTTILETSDTIITTNNIQYYQGDVGIGLQPCGLISHTSRDYFVYPTNGNIYRLSADGLTNLSELYKGQFYFKNLLTPYNGDIVVGRNGNKSFLKGAFDYFDEQFIYVLPGGTERSFVLRVGINAQQSSQTWNLGFQGFSDVGDLVSVVVTDGVNTETFNYTCVSGDTTQTISQALVNLINLSTHFTASTFIFVVQYGLKIHSNIGVITVTPTVTITSSPTNRYAFSFNDMNDNRRGFCSFYDFENTEWIQSAGDRIVTWLDGDVYINDSGTYCNFFNQQFDCSVTVPFNQNMLEKKSWMAISEEANVIWHCPSIYSNVMSYGAQRQETTLVSQEFTLLEGMPHSSIKRDSNSRGGKINGNFIKGNVLVVKFQVTNAADLSYLNTVSMLIKDSPLTVKA